MNSWLYARNGDSVRIVEVTPLHLEISGPGAQRATVRFDHPEQGFAYRQQNGNILTGAGYRFLGLGADRRRRERRQAGRPGSDRRR